MAILNPLVILPLEIQQKWMAAVDPTVPTLKGAYRLVKIRPTQAGSFEEQRIIVRVIDENGLPLADVPVAFSFSTASPYLLTPDFQWTPPAPARAFIVPARGDGEIDMVQGSAVKEGQPGGVTVYLLDRAHSSDVVSGLGMLSDHTGLCLTFQLQRNGVRPVEDRLAEIEVRLSALEGVSNG